MELIQMKNGMTKFGGNKMKKGNVNLEEIDSVVNSFNLSEEKAKELRERLKNNYTSFLPCDIPQEKIISRAMCSEYYGDIIDFMYASKSSPKDMETAFLYKKHSVNIDFIVKRISKIYSEPQYCDRIKELYYRESFCNEDMIGTSTGFYYKWYSAVIEYCNFVQNKVSIKTTFDLFQELLLSGLEFAGNNIHEVFSQILDIDFLEYAENKNAQIIIDLLSNQLFQISGDFSSALYKNIVKTGFSTPNLNPEKMILDEWDNSEYYCGDITNIAYHFGIQFQEVIDLLLEKGRISGDTIIDSWDKGDEVDEISSETGFLTEEVQYILKKNIGRLKRTDDLHKLDWDYNWDDDY